MKVGKVSENVLKRSILKQIKTKRNEIKSGAGIGEDCAIFAFPENYALTSNVQAATITSAEDMINIIHKCVNNITASGAEPIGVMLALILPECIEEESIKNLMAAAEYICGVLNIEIAGGHTTVSKTVNQPVVSVTGYGMGQKEKVCITKGAKPGQDIVLSKWIGLEGTAILAKRCREDLLTRYPSYLVEEASEFDKYLSVVPEAAVALKSDVCAMHDASEGGIFAALWELAESSGVGLSIDLKKLPIRQETVEVCEFFGLNPYELISGGCLLMTTEDGLGLVQALEAEHIHAVVVGKITDKKEKVIIRDKEIRFLTRPDTDEIYKARIFREEMI